MDNYLEIKGVSTAPEIEETYLQAVKENIPYYRAISKTGKIYGWEINSLYPNGHHVPAKEGQEWFVNEKYVEPTEEEPIESIAKQPEFLAETVEKDETDYKAKYEDSQKEVEMYRTALREKDSQIEELKKEVNELTPYKEVIVRLKEL